MTSRYTTMSDDELRELSKQKVKRTGCFSKVALAAQKELWNRKHWNTYDDLIEELDERDRNIERSIEDIQYNG